VSAPEGGRRRLPIVMRSAAALSVAVVATVTILTGAAASSAALTSVKVPAAARNATTLDGGTASSAGKMTVTVTDVPRRGGALTLTSLRYAGGAAATAKNPALVLMIAPAGPPCVSAVRAKAIASASLAAGGPRQIRCRAPGRRHARLLVLAIRLRLHSLHSFSGKLPASVIQRINAHGGVPAGELLTTSLASVTISKSHHHINIQARLYLQVGILLSPGGLF
jgi:hypothetical protein